MLPVTSGGDEKTDVAEARYPLPLRVFGTYILSQE